jgi:centromere protein C
MAPRGSSIGASSPARATSHPAVARRIDFSQDESSLQETPALSGSGQRRGKRSSVYDIPEDSPVSETGGGLESFVQAEITANEGSTVINSFVEQSSIAQIADDTTNGMEDVADLAETEITPEPAKEPRKRGRKRKSDVLEPSQESSSAAKLAKRGAASAQVSETQRKGKNSVPIPAASTRRSKRVSDMAEQEPSVLEASADTTAEPVESPKADPPPKRRGRPPRAKPEAGKQEPVPPKPANNIAAKATTSGDFKKPPKPVTAKPKEKPVVPRKAEAKQAEEAPRPTDEDSGKLVDVHGHPLSKKQIDQMSATSTGSRYGRGRHLSVFRELEPEAVARVGRTGRHRVAPIDFWKNDRIAYDTSGNMTSIVKYQDTEPERKAYKPSSSKRGRKRNLTMVEEEEVELDPWEEEEGVLVGNYRDYDPTTEVTLSDIIEDSELCCLWKCIYGFSLSSRYRMGPERDTARHCRRHILPLHKAICCWRILQLGSH